MNNIDEFDLDYPVEFRYYKKSSGMSVYRHVGLISSVGFKDNFLCYKEKGAESFKCISKERIEQFKTWQPEET